MKTTELPAVQHTPTPWASTRRTFNYGCYGHEITCPDWVANLSTVQASSVIALIHTDDDRDRANAAFIVRACNSHEALVAALRDAYESLSRLDDKEGAYRVTALAQARATLANLR